MASSGRMMIIGIGWITGMTVLALTAYLGPLLMQPVIDNLLMTTVFVDPIAESVGTFTAWIFGFYYFMHLAFAITLTYVCYQQTIVVTDYFPDSGVY